MSSFKEIEKKYRYFEKLCEYKNIYDRILNNKKNIEYFDSEGNAICFNSSSNNNR